MFLNWSKSANSERCNLRKKTEGKVYMQIYVIAEESLSCSVHCTWERRSWECVSKHQKLEVSDVKRCFRELFIAWEGSEKLSQLLEAIVWTSARSSVTELHTAVTKWGDLSVRVNFFAQTTIRKKKKRFGESRVWWDTGLSVVCFIFRVTSSPAKIKTNR